MSFRTRGLVGELKPWADYLIELLEGAGYRVRVTSVVRSLDRQAELYARRARNPYPVARPGCSQHNYGIAWDMVTEPYSGLFEAGPVWQGWGGSWGGRVDPIHFSVFWSRPLGC